MPKSVGDRRAVFTTPWFDLVAKTIDGEKAPYYSLQMSDYVTVLAITARQEILVVRQYRPALERYTLELPSGHVEPGETPADAARREFLEETGYIVDKLELLGCLAPDTGRLSNRLWGFLAKNVIKDSSVHALESGIEPVLMTREELASQIIDGQFDHALHLAVLMLAVMRDKLPLANAKQTL